MADIASCSGASEVNNCIPSCILCFRLIEKVHERYLVSGKRSKFDVQAAIQQLPFNVIESSLHTCRQCHDKLRKRSSLISQEKNIVSELKANYEGGKLKRRPIYTEEGLSIKNLNIIPLLSREGLSTTASPFQVGSPPLCKQIPAPIAHSTPVKCDKQPTKTSVKVKVTWPSKTTQKELQPDLESLGKMLVRGTYRQIANAAWGNKQIRKHLVLNVMKDIDNECIGLCSKNNPSCVRSPSKEKMLNFSFEKQKGELQQRAPLLLSVLVAAASCKSKRDERAWIPAIGMASAVLLRNRSPYMNAVQLMLGIFLYHSNWAPTMSRLAKLRLVTSPNHLYKKLEEFGADHDSKVKEMVNNDATWLGSQKGEKTTTDVKPSAGFKLVIDNVDYRQNVHYMTEEHQTIDKHYVSVNATTNRITANHLSHEAKADGIAHMENGKCIPSHSEQKAQRDNYISLVKRVLVERVPCLEFGKDIVQKHIPHKYSKEASQPTESSFIGVIYESENDANGINKILEKLHEYVPFVGDKEGREYLSQPIVGDQLTVERAVNAHMTLCNGFTPEERLEGLHFEIADWHAGNKALGVAFSNLYNPASSGDKCTLYSDRNLINRRNVKSDVDSAVNAARRFFVLEVEARIVAAAMTELEMDEFDDTPENDPAQICWTTKERKEYLHKLSCTIVDKYILDGKKHKRIAAAVDQLDERQLQSLKDKTANGRYKCRFPGCPKTFSSDGKWRQLHEKSHNPPVCIEEQPMLVEIYSGEVVSDDMYNYQRALLDYGMVIMNFLDAISEGDGERVIRSWKFLLLYFQHDKGSQKYSLEALYLMFQVYALLNPKAAHQCVWNRFSKRKHSLGGNISHDLALEFLNRMFKDAVKKLGPNATQRSIDRICHAMGVTKQLTENFDSSMTLYKRSGIHSRKSDTGDLKKIVNELLFQNALTILPGRSYGFFSEIKPSLLSGFNLQKFYAWISEHKKYMILHRKAR